nr:MAG: replication initiator protein [Microvirus sp.]
MCLNPIYLKEQNMFVNCRKCAECKMARAKEWSVRLYSELKTNPEACFISLSYKDSPRSLVKADLQNFIKRLRKDYQLKYFACGEYGDKYLRPHFHAILYGVNFKDKKLFSKSAKGKDIWISDTLAKYWPYGIHSIQECTFATMIYTALYAQKDKKLLPDGLLPEFNLFSKGLGNDYLMEKLDTFLETDQVYIDGHSYKIPESVLKKCFVSYDDKGRIISKDQKLVELKEARKEKQENYFPSQTALINKMADCYGDDSIPGWRLIEEEKEYRAMREANLRRAEKIQKIKNLTKSKI